MNRITKIAISEIDLAADTGKAFSIDDVVDEVFKQVKDLGIEDEELRDLCRQKVNQVDARKHAGATGQLDLITGEDATLDQILVIGAGQRIKKRNATFRQWFEGRAIEQAVFADQAAAEAVKVKIDSVLIGLWTAHPQWTYEQVLAAYPKPSATP
jgi:hypothetical protein